LLGLALLILFFLVLGSMSSGREKMFNPRITLNKKDKIPYGLYVAYESLDRFFPGAPVQSTRSSRAFHDLVSAGNRKQLLVIITDKFTPSEEEMSELAGFAGAGNSVLISTVSLSLVAEKAFRCSVNEEANPYASDSLELNLIIPGTGSSREFRYPGYHFASWLDNYDTATTEVLGKMDEHFPVFFRYRAGEGSIYLHLAPLAFSNYFLLHKNNIKYYNELFSFFPQNVEKVFWDEYFISKKSNQDNDRSRGWWSVMMGIPSLRAFLLSGIIILLLFVLLGMRRRQREIPQVDRPRNESLDFVRTIGNLYFNKKDNKNLSLKMSNYFLEYAREHYRLSTSALDEGFVRNLHFKSGYPLEELQSIVAFIRHLGETPSVSDEQITVFYKKLELFYKNV